MDTLEKLKALEQDLFLKELLLESIAQSFQDPVFIIDSYGKFVDIVGGKERSAYHGGKFLIDKYLQDVLPAEIADAFMLAINAAIEKNSLQTVEYQLGSEDIAGAPADNPKGRQWYETRVYPLKAQDNDIESVIFFPINITLRKKMAEEIVELSETDQLTKVLNRRYFMKVLENEFAIAKRYNNTLSVLHIAIDKLQDINDEFGEVGGDAVLKRFAILCKSTLRDSDLFARFGGAGFIAMLPNTPSLGAAIIGERIRAISENLQVEFEDQTIQFAISMGISQTNESDKNFNAVLTRADSALYQAKTKGRNRIEIN
ncbi:MAG: diguanylate cyclase [Deltaproteobacteria bacterium]|jgi:diguanylate cyclase (GGDEF)-like protein|nr:diguanylate cyclase [Deltaproteobacteria bacterium]